jgi:hypothetical protein
LPIVAKTDTVLVGKRGERIGQAGQLQLVADLGGEKSSVAFDGLLQCAGQTVDPPNRTPSCWSWLWRKRSTRASAARVSNRIGKKTRNLPIGLAPDYEQGPDENGGHEQDKGQDQASPETECARLRG